MCYVKQARKVLNNLASDVLIAANGGVGDITKLIEGEKVGAIVKGFNKKSYIEALEKNDELRKTSDLSEKAAQVRGRNFISKKSAARNIVHYTEDYWQNKLKNY